MSCFQGLLFCPEAASLLLHNFCIYHISPPGHEVLSKLISYIFFFCYFVMLIFSQHLVSTWRYQIRAWMRVPVAPGVDVDRPHARSTRHPGTCIGIDRMSACLAALPTSRSSAPKLYRLACARPVLSCLACARPELARIFPLWTSPVPAMAELFGAHPRSCATARQPRCSANYRQG
jgi:hypothetical protein